SLDELSVHVLMMGIDFEVIEPPELTEVLREARDRLTRALDGP
ncbi:DNA-binding transcriptional regulator, partial [Streptomyces globisporus]